MKVVHIKYDFHFLIFVFKKGSHYPHVSLAYLKKSKLWGWQLSLFLEKKKTLLGEVSILYVRLSFKNDKIISCIWRVRLHFLMLPTLCSIYTMQLNTFKPMPLINIRWNYTIGVKRPLIVCAFKERQ